MASGFKTGGRKKGSRNKKTVLREETGRQALAKALGPDASEVDAHSLLKAVYMDKSHPIELRVDAAKAAIRFEKPALAAVATRGTIESVHYAISDKPMTEDERAVLRRKFHPALRGGWPDDLELAVQVLVAACRRRHRR